MSVSCLTIALISFHPSYTGSFAVDSGIVGGQVIFAGVGLFPGLCGFVLTVSSKQHTRSGGQSDPQSTSWREGPTKEQPNNNQNPITPREPTQMA